MDLLDKFANTNIDNESFHLKNFQDTEGGEEGIDVCGQYKNYLGGKDILQLKGNHIPRGMIPLEKLFDQNDVAKYPKMKPTEDSIEDKNIGAEDS